MPPNNSITLQSGTEELECLIRLVDAAESLLLDGDARFGAWRAAAAALKADKDLDSLTGETALDDLAFAFRDTWLDAAFQATRSYLMSPPHEQPKTMPSGDKFQFDYERSSRPESLERRGLHCLSSPQDWTGFCLLFSSGMSAISTVVQVCCAHLDGAKPESPVNLDIFGGYFETWRLLDAMHTSVLTVRYHPTNEEINRRVAGGGVDVLVIEPVAYDWDMSVFDLDRLRDAWRQAGTKHPRVVIVDTSLTAHTFGPEDLTAVFGDTPPWLVVFIRSGLKLDQQGLELSNVGVVNLFLPDGGGKKINKDGLKQKLTVNRAVTGGALTVNQTAALEAPWFLKADQLAAFAGQVFGNNRRLAVNIKNDGGVFSRINHPGLETATTQTWAVSPFVVFHLSEDSQNRHGLLVAILVHEARLRGLPLTLGSSFGFRGHRFEVIRPHVQIRAMQDKTGLLKVAMGFRQGPTLQGVIDLINEIAAYPDWPALVAAYPNVKAYVKGGFGVYVERPPRP